MNYFDLHCDTPYKCYAENLSFSDNRLAVSRDSVRGFDKWFQCFAVWISDEIENPYTFYKNVLVSFKQKLVGKPCNLTPVFTVEGGRLIEKNINRLAELKEDGIRALTLTWNGENNIAGGCKSEGILTDFGRDVINEMNRLKIICDLSHLNEKSFYPAVDTALFPAATHSNCRAVCNNPRNLNDTQIKLIAEKGGVVGLCFYPPFLGDDTFDKIYRNIFHLLDMGLEDHISIGSDFDGGDMSASLSKAGDVLQLYEYLIQRGITCETADKIFFKNAYLFFERVDKYGRI